MFTNVAPEVYYLTWNFSNYSKASGFITPEEAGEKAYVRTTIDHDAIVTTPVLLGT